MKEVLWRADLGDGRYRNPILYTDYSDPDVIRVGDTYYLTASSFQYTPGLPVLTSGDLVNWELVSYAVDNIREPGYEAPRHGDGVWAPSIRYHAGVFYIFYGMPDEGIYCVKTTDPAGKWDPPVCVRRAKGFIDPCPFLDTDGRLYIVHAYAKSRIGFKSKLGVFEADPETLQSISEDRFIFDGNDPAHPAETIEGPKVYRRGEYIYILAPAGGVAHGDQRALRAREIGGPYEIRTVCRQGSTAVNGPHQGGLTDTVSGEEWFLHFQSAGMYGRIAHLQPVRWENGWPVIGVNADAEGCGEPVSVCRKPDTAPSEISYPPASDRFPGGRYGLQWQWTADHDDSVFCVRRPEQGGETPDGLALRAFDPTGTGRPLLWDCPNLLTQKFCCPAFEAETVIDLRALRPGGRAGVCVFGGVYASLSVRLTEDGKAVLEYAESCGDSDERQERILCAEETAAPQKVRLLQRLTREDGEQPVMTFALAEEDGPYRPFGRSFVPSGHTWVGARLGLFALADAAGTAEAGYAVFESFSLRALPEDGSGENGGEEFL